MSDTKIAFEIWPVRTACARLNISAQTLRRDYGDLFRRENKTKVLFSNEAYERADVICPKWDEEL